MALATWRVSSLVVNESGPFDMFLRLRKWAGIEHDINKIPTVIPERFFSGLLSCVWCTSVWIGIAVTAVWIIAPQIAFWGCLPLALSAGAVMVQMLLESR